VTLAPLREPGLSQVLSDLVNAGERLGTLLQVLIARVDVGLHGERDVVVTRPLADDRDRHAGLLHQRQGGVPGVVQPDLAEAGPLEQVGELVGVPLGVHRKGQLVGDDVLIAGRDSAEGGEPGSVRRAHVLALPGLPFARLDERRDKILIEWKRPLAVAGLGFLDAHLEVSDDARLADGKRPGLQVDVGPAQAKDFAAPQTVEAEPPGRVQPVGRRCGRERPDLGL
jgi:hypothetical protein